MNSKKKNLLLNKALAEKGKFADLINGAVFNGEKVFSEEALEECNINVSYSFGKGKNRVECSYDVIYKATVYGEVMYIAVINLLENDPLINEKVQMLEQLAYLQQKCQYSTEDNSDEKLQLIPIRTLVMNYDDEKVVNNSTK